MSHVKRVDFPRLVEFNFGVNSFFFPLAVFRQTFAEIFDQTGAELISVLHNSGESTLALKEFFPIMQDGPFRFYYDIYLHGFFSKVKHGRQLRLRKPPDGGADGYNRDSHNDD